MINLGSASCGNGYQFRFRKCRVDEDCKSTKEIKSCNLGDCESSTSETNPPAESSTREYVFPTPSPMEYVSAYWSDWSEWTACNQTCSNRVEFSQRTRECIIPHKVGSSDFTKMMSVRNDCTGVNREIRQCPASMSKSCETERKQTSKKNNLNSIGRNNTTVTTEWSEWSECSVKCGIGSRTRIRRCDRQRDTLMPCQLGSELVMERTMCNITCSSTHDEVRPLTSTQLPPTTPTTTTTQSTSLMPPSTTIFYPSMWSEWSEWSKCEAKCGTDLVKRRRKCLGPARGCVGSDVETRTCVNNEGCEMSVEKPVPLIVPVATKRQNLTELCKNGGCSRSNLIVLNNIGIKVYLDLDLDFY